jgi:transcriptional regulator with XRE-family HTH domain
MSILDGPTLRALREQHNVPLRQVARLSGMSHSHLSKLEHGEPGRPVTSTVLAKRAARAGVDIGSHVVARTMQLVALHAAAMADAPDLRARVIADIAVHLDVLEHHADSQAVVRLGEIDERITDQTSEVLHEVKTRAADAEQRVATAVHQALESKAASL